MRLIVISICISVYVQCRPTPKVNQPVGLFAFWSLLQDTVVNFIASDHRVRAYEKAVSILTSRKTDTPEIKPVETTPRVWKPSTKSWIWCSDKDPNETFAYKPCPGDRNFEECLIRTNANRADVLELRAGTWKTKTDDAVKQWALCYLTKVGVMSSAGVLRQDVVLKTVPQEDKVTVEEAIDKCLYKERHDPVETAWHYLTCFRYEVPEYAKANRI